MQACKRIEPDLISNRCCFKSGILFFDTIYSEDMLAGVNDSKRGSVRSTNISSSEERQLRAFDDSRIVLSICTVERTVSKFIWWWSSGNFLSTVVDKKSPACRLLETGWVRSCLSTVASGVWVSMLPLALREYGLCVEGKRTTLCVTGENSRQRLG